jgi:hypothetical protein
LGTNLCFFFHCYHSLILDIKEKESRIFIVQSLSVSGTFSVYSQRLRSLRLKRQYIVMQNSKEEQQDDSTVQQSGGRASAVDDDDDDDEAIQS